MRRYTTWAGGFILGLGLVLAAQPAHAVIKRLVPLKEYLDETVFIFTAKVDSIDAAADPPRMVLTVDQDLKDKAPFRRLPVNLGIPSKEGDDEKHVEKLLKRVAIKQPVMIFVQKRGKKFIGYGYANGTWFQMTGEGDPVVWRFLNLEPYLRRTFKGTTEEMTKIVADSLAGKAQPPGPDEGAEPGFGPEIKPEEKKDKPPEESRRPGRGFSSGPLFAVIPTAAIGGLVSILAMYFGFTGLAPVIRRWLVAVSVLSFNFTLFSTWWWFSATLRPTWYGSVLALWTYMTVIVVIGLLWSWRRQLRAQSPLPPANGTAPTAPAPLKPGRAELITIASLALLDLVGTVVAFAFPRTWFDADTRTFLLVHEIGFMACLLYGLLLWLADRRGRLTAPPPVTPEGVMLGGTGVGLLLFGVLMATPVAATAAPDIILEESGGAEAAVVKPVGVAWKWQATERGVIFSTPAVTREQVFAAASHGSAFPFGRVYCLDRASGKVLWSFDDDDEMKQVFSSPTVAGGRVYVGEGFHQDRDCKMYCLDAATGQKKWSFQTSSHTESSPCVVGDKVYFGAGDDGVYCLNAENGKEIWHFTKLHVDTSPAVVDGKLYAGSGVGDVYQQTCMFCLDAATGKEVWRIPTELPVWGSPTVSGSHVFFGLGTGDFTQSSQNPAGAVMCLEAATGKRIWEMKVADGVLDRPAVDRHRVYFGSRDHHVYCVSRKDGSLVWKKDVGSPVVASVALARAPGTGASSLYALSSTGRLVCFDPETGQVDYVFDVKKDANAQPELYSSLSVQIVPDDKGVKRQIIFGAGLNNFVSRAATVYCYEDQWPE